MGGETKLTELIDGASQVLDSLVQESCNNLEFNEPFEFLFKSSFDDSEDNYNKLEQAIDLGSFDYKVVVPEDTNEEDKESIVKEVESHNESVEQRLKDFIHLRVLSEVTDKYLASFVDVCKDSQKAEDPENINIKDINIQTVFQDIYKQISVLLDFIIDFTRYDNGFKRVFYQIISTISQILLDIETKYLEMFWYYLESRFDVIQTRMFNKELTGDRISILEICNPLTDKYYQKDNDGVNTYKKDTFNDSLQARIRLFINKLFNMEDNTGLNKYFSVSNRVLPESSLNRKRDNFVNDVLECFKVMRDPYSYLKSNRIRSLKNISNTFFKLLDKLLPMELEHLTKTQRDRYVRKKTFPASEAEYLKEKYDKKPYFPEIYWVSVFNKNRATLEKEVNDDQDFFHDLFDDSEYRQVFLVQLYLVSSFFAELSSNFKRDLLKGYPANTKHMVDDFTNEAAAKNFFIIKKEMVKELREVDSTYSFLLQQIDSMERQWWQWLLYGRDLNTKEPLLSNKTLPKEALDETESKFSSLFPIKEKRYFNIYATPQLSRRMKGTRGLENIHIKRLDDASNEDSMDYEDANMELNNIRVWKQFRRKRQHQWLEFGSILDDSVVSEPKPEPTKDEEPEPSKNEEPEPSKDEEPQPTKDEEPEPSIENEEPQLEEPEPKKLKLEQ